MSVADVADRSEFSENEYYSVDRIIGKRVRKGVVYYLVKWQGYDESKSTWEPMENCEEAMSSILEFEEELSVKSCPCDQIEIVGIEPSGSPNGGITVLVKTKVADRVFKFSNKEVAERWPNLYVDFLENHIKFWKRSSA